MRTTQKTTTTVERTMDGAGYKKSTTNSYLRTTIRLRESQLDCEAGRAGVPRAHVHEVRGSSCEQVRGIQRLKFLKNLSLELFIF